MNENGDENRVLNKKETMLASQKQDAMKVAFKDWIFKDRQRRERLVKVYNERFNSIRPREYDGSHLTFPGMNGMHYKLSAEEMELLAMHRAELDAKLEIVSEKKAELEEEAAKLDRILNVIDKIIDSTEVEY